MSLRGGWKYLRQTLNLVKHASTEYICFLCDASKGAHDQQNNYTNLALNAPWRSTVYACTPAWKVAPAFTKLCFFNLKKVGLDMLHVWHLGVARDMCL